MSGSFPWASGPLALIETPKHKLPEKDDIYHNAATMMACVHNCFIRAFNHVYNIAPSVPKSDYKNFIQYSYAIYETLHQHHHEEETYVFPRMEKEAGVPGLMEANVEQHAAFESGLQAFGTYLRELLDEKRVADFSPETFRQHIDRFADALGHHLHEEIDTIINLKNYPDMDLKKLFQESHEEAMKNQKMLSGLPLLFLNHDRTYENGVHGIFPPAPAAISFGLRKIAPVYHWGWWKYAVSDSNCQPKPIAV